MMRRLLIGAVGLYVVYAVVMVWLHPRLIYPFLTEPFESAIYQRHDLDNGPTVYVHDAGDQATLVVYFMGNVGALGPFRPMLDHHRAAGRSVIAMGYRGGGGLPGTPSESVLKADALAAFDAAADLVSGSGQVFVQGYSLGTGLALHVAARRQIDGLILSAPYAKLCRLMTRSSFLPACWLPGVQKWVSTRDARKSLNNTLVLHGSSDQLVPVQEGRRLFRNIESDNYILEMMTEIKAAGHNDLMSFPIYLRSIDGFIEVLGRAQ